MAAREFIEVMAETLNAIAPGLKDFGPDVTAEMSRLGTQGQMEMANALFNGSAFVPYGPGQYTPMPELNQGVHDQDFPDLDQQQERGGMER